MTDEKRTKTLLEAIGGTIVDPPKRRPGRPRTRPVVPRMPETFAEFMREGLEPLDHAQPAYRWTIRLTIQAESQTLEGHFDGGVLTIDGGAAPVTILLQPDGAMQTTVGGVRDERSRGG